MAIKNRFNELLQEKARHEGRAISQRTAAEEAGVSLSTIHRWATQRITSWDEETWEKLARYFECEVPDLIAKNDPESDAPALISAGAAL